MSKLCTICNTTYEDDNKEDKYILRSDSFNYESIDSQRFCSKECALIYKQKIIDGLNNIIKGVESLEVYELIKVED